MTMSLHVLILTKREKCIKVAEEYLNDGQSVAIGTDGQIPHRYINDEDINCLLDNTNADIEVRSKWVALAAKHSVPIRCVWFTTASAVCEHNAVVRALNPL